MAFYEEPTNYLKSALSDLQGAWGNLRETVVNEHPFPEWKRVLFHIDERMSWESVRDLKKMEKALLLIENITAQAQVPDEVAEGVDAVRGDLDEVYEALAKGEVD